MTREELNYIKDAFSQIIDDIAGNPDWYEAARAIASDLGTLERKLEKKISSLPSNLDEAAENHMLSITTLAFDERDVILSFKTGAIWMAGQGYTREVDIKEDAGGYPYIQCIELYDYDKEEPLFKPGDKVVVQIRKK